MAANWEEVEKKLRRRGRLVIKNKNPSTNFNVFMDNLITLVRSQGTIYPKAKTKQCHAGAFRSLDDLYRVTINYFPETTFKDFAKEIFKIGGSIQYSYCNDVKKVVFYEGMKGSLSNYNTRSWRRNDDKFEKIADQLGIEESEYYENAKTTETKG